jgi:hypothetical protein
MILIMKFQTLLGNSIIKKIKVVLIRVNLKKLTFLILMISN